MTTRDEFVEEQKDKPQEPMKIDSPIGTIYKLDGNERYEKPEFLVDDLLVKGSVTILAGNPKSGKGWLALIASKKVIEDES